MDNHLLLELVYVFYRIHASVIHGERGLVETPGKLCLFYSPGEGWSKNLAQSFFHNVSSYSPPRWTLAPPLVRMFFLIGKWFTRWSSWSLLVACIFLVIRRNVRAGGHLFSLCSTESLFKIVNFSLHCFFISLLVYCVTSSSITTSTCVERLQAAFLLVVHVISMFKVVKLTLLMNISWFCMVQTSLVWSWSRHNHYNPLKH